MTTFDEIVSVVGEDVATKLVAKFGGRVTYLPRLSGREGPRSKVKEVVRLFRDHASLTQISDSVHLSVPTIIDILEMEMTIV